MKNTTSLLARTALVCNLNATRRACLWAALGLFATLAFGPPPAQAAVTEAWVHRYNGTNSDYSVNNPNQKMLWKKTICPPP